MNKQIKLLLITTSAIFLLLACEQASDNEQPTDSDQSVQDEQIEEDTYTYPEVEENPIVTITMEDDKEIIIELFPDIAPNTVANFISLIESGFYDGLTFHRVIPGFMIQGGDPEGTGIGGPGYSIAGEFSTNDFENDLAHVRGVISMARSGSPNSAGSQFFIMQDVSPHLDGSYAGFGQVLEGMSVVDEITYLKRDENDKPLEDYKMKSVTVDTKGVDYPEPIKE